MNLPYFTDEAFNALKNHRAENEARYYSGTSWLAEFFRSLAISEPCRSSSIIVPDLKLQSGAAEDDEKNSEDLSNIRILYGAYKDKITPTQATNPKLWTALCHTKFSEYTLTRWRRDDGKVNIDQRFFATDGRASLCYYNAISRLWWIGYLSYDESCESTNPWHLTETLLTAQQILKDYSDQGFSMSKTVSIGLLSALKRVQEESGAKTTTTFRRCCDSYLNHYAAVTVIDVLEPEEIENIAYEFMIEHL